MVIITVPDGTTVPLDVLIRVAPELVLAAVRGTPLEAEVRQVLDQDRKNAA